MSKFIENLKGMNQEDLEGVREMLDSDEEFENQFKSQLDNLDAAGKAQVKGIVLGEEIDVEDSEIPEGQKVQAARRESSGLDTVKDVFTSIGGNIPFAEDISANINAAGAEIGEALGLTEEKDFSQRVQENRSEFRKEVARAEQRSPIVSATAAMGTDIGTSFLAGGAAIKTIGAISNIGKASTMIGSEVVLETVRNFSDSENRTMEDLGKSAQGAALIAAGGLALGAAGSKIVGTIGGAFSTRFETLMKSRGVARVIKSVDEFVESTRGRISSKDYTDALKDIPNYVEDIAKNNFSKAQKNLDSYFFKVKDQVKSAITDLEGKLGQEFGLLPSQTKDLHRSITRELRDIVQNFSKHGGKKAKLRAARALEDLDDAFLSTTVTEFGTIKAGKPLKYGELGTILRGLEKTLPKKLQGKAGIMGRIRASRNAILDKSFTGLEEIVQSKLNFLKGSNKKIEILHHAKSLKNSIRAEMTAIENGQTAYSILGTAISKTQSKAPGAAAFGYGIAGFLGSKVAVGVVGAKELAKAALNSPKLVGKLGSLLPQTAKLEKIGKFYINGTGQRSMYYGALMTRLGQSLNGLDPERTENTVNALNATQSLLSTPLDRSTDSLMQRKQDIDAILRVENPELLEELNETLQENGNVGPIMEAITKIPAAKELVKEGVGWDGKVYNPEDKAALRKSVENQPLISSAQKIDMLEQLSLHGTIPNLEEAEIRKPRKYRAKPKKYRPY